MSGEGPATPSTSVAGEEPVPWVEIELVVNGRARRVAIAPHHSLLEVLRRDLRLTGTKECCLVGECGACTVLLDGRSVDACLVLAAEAAGRAVLTVEGLAGDGGLDRLQRAFQRTGAAQCGFCIPGQLLSARALLDRNPRPTRAEIEEGLAGNLCRCAGYEQIMEAVSLAAEDGATDSGAGIPVASRGAGGRGRGDAPDPAAVPDARVAPQ